MVVSRGQESHAETVLEYDRIKELKAFDETKAGVKGLTDNAVAKVPKIFVRPAEELAEELNCRWADIQVPVVEHGIPVGVLEEMIEGVRLFHEQDVEAKKEF
ncbi:hypothetical protein RJ639_002003 [Escallonia herrerae]|uniref:Uncharacterized protein n=1 Tax=Escallonia herrerae TaxID=1293975 RepID=A0AA89BGY4_9ASTE|nr:hypothetical protein RJ639_002003 [Escallonia herrerae]